MAKSKYKQVFKIFVGHQIKVEDVLNKNFKEDPTGQIEVAALCEYQGNKLAILFVTSVEELAPKIIKDTERIRLFYGEPKKVQVDMNNVSINTIVSMVCTGKYLNVLCIASDIIKEEVSPETGISIPIIKKRIE